MKIRVISNNSQLINQIKAAHQINIKNKPEPKISVGNEDIDHIPKTNKSDRRAD